jgi:hypothetical protein
MSGLTLRPAVVASRFLPVVRARVGVVVTARAGVCGPGDVKKSLGGGEMWKTLEQWCWVLLPVGLVKKTCSSPGAAQSRVVGGSESIVARVPVVGGCRDVTLGVSGRSDIVKVEGGGDERARGKNALKVG